MPTTTEKIQPTREAVLKVFTDSTIEGRARNEKAGQPTQSPFKAMRLYRIAEHLGVTLDYDPHATNYQNDPMRQVRAQLDLPVLERILDELVAEGLVLQGEGKYGVPGVTSPMDSRKGTLWWYDGAYTQWRAKELRKLKRRELREKAQQAVLEQYNVQVQANYEALCLDEGITPEEEA